MLAPPAIFLNDHRHLTFDFEEYIKKELGLDLDNENKKEGQLSHETPISKSSWLNKTHKMDKCANIFSKVLVPKDPIASSSIPEEEIETSQ